MAIILGVLVGLALGLTGGGGSILAVPLLVYGLGIEPKNAVVLSLAVVGLTALLGAVAAWRQHLLEKRAALIFAAGGVLAAPFGVMLGDQFADNVLILVFAVLMLAVATRMLINALKHPDEAKVVRGDFATGSELDMGTVCQYSHDGRLRMTAPCGFVLVLLGLLTGALSGLFGVGGGFLIVPALMLVTQMGIHRAVATSLLVITLIGLTGMASTFFSARSIDWLLACLFLAGGLGGMLLGRRLAQRLAGPVLQMVFAIIIVAVAGYMLVNEIVA